MRTRLSWTILGFGTLALAACTGTGGNVGGNTGGGGSTSTGSTSTGSTSSSGNPGTGGTAPLATVDKIDIVLDIDNARAMGDMQEILALGLSDLIVSLTNPPCVDGNGVPSSTQPAGPTDACPAGTKREFVPILDIHVGVITSSIGGHGSDSCPDQETFSCPGGATNTSNNDHGHLVTRTDPCMAGDVPTYQGEGFLAWDPTQKDTPPGENNAANFTTNIKDLVLGAGQLGCGYRSQMESWYRFLVDPAPYQSLVVDANGLVAGQGVDDVLLQQRRQFLRPDSLLAILSISDKNDCSTKESGQFFLADQQRNPNDPNQTFHLPNARSECKTNPADPCCASCGQVTPTGCPADPACTANPISTDQTDDLNLRCWDQKRRFGIDFLYPTDRYVNALTSPTVPDQNGNLMPNPVFSNLDPATYPNATVRDPGLVVLAGIVGVPWQDLARDPTDLTKGYKTAVELAAANNGVTTWDVILGDLATFKNPLDPHMIESDAPRTGTDPIGGVTLASPSMTAGGSDVINGHEYTPGAVMGMQGVPNDLEYACIFPLQTPRDCTDPSQTSCECTDPLNDNPLCAANGSNGRTLQTSAQGYPGLRQLDVLRGLGPQGVAASICPAQQTDPTRADYAYRPAIEALVARVRSRLPAM